MTDVALIPAAERTPAQRREYIFRPEVERLRRSLGIDVGSADRVVQSVLGTARRPARERREPVPLSGRFRVLKRCHFTCMYCGRRAGEDVELEVDHVVPVAKGGGNEESNLTAACRDCNNGKSDSLVEQ